MIELASESSAPDQVGGRLQFAITVTGRPEGDVSPQDQIREIVDLVHAARDSGFDALVIGQHFLTSPYRYLQPIPLLSRLVPESGEMKLITGILLLPLLAPVSLAEDLATLDVMSGGRLVVGVGLGYRDAEFAAFGVPREERVARQEESLRLLTELWSGGEVDFSGAFHTVRATGAAIRPVQRPHPPIWLAANSDRTVRRAVRRGLAPYIGPRPAREDVERWLADTYPEPAAARVPIRRELFLAGRDEAAETALRYLGPRNEMYRQWGRERDGSGAVSGQTLDAVKRSAIVGDQEDCLAELESYARMGVSMVVFRVIWPGLGHHGSLSMVEAVGKQIIPHFREV